MKIWYLISKYYITFAAIFIGIFGYPLVLKVNFWQNDDPFYYRNVLNFLNGNFILLQETAPTFYSQGILALLWSSIFGISSLPLLTFIISILNFYIFSKIIELKFSFSKITNILIGLVLFTNFLHSYSSIGFMTDNYLLFFILLAIYYFEKFEKMGKNIYIHLSNIFSLLAFFVKQNSLVFLFATSIYFLIKKQYKDFFNQIIYLISISLFYFFIFPQTSEMKDKNFSLSKIIHFDDVFSLTYGILIICAFYTIPLILTSVFEYIKTNFDYKKIILLTILSASFFIFLNSNFRIGKMSFQEFPYFENVFERTGFYPRTIHGTKYQFRFNFDYFRYSDLVSKILVSCFISLLILKFTKIINIYSISLFGLFFLMLFVSSFFDRYILLFIPFSIILILYFYRDSFFSKLLLGFFVLYQFVFSYMFSIDFINTNNFIWSKSQDLVKNGVSAQDIYATSAWGDVYGKSSSIGYLFSYDSAEVNSEIKEKFDLVEIKDFTDRASLFINPKIYLYKSKVK